MAQTVIGFFDDQADAAQAVARLESSGISRDRIDLSQGGAGSSNDPARAAGSADVNAVSGSARDENSVRLAGDDRTVDEEGRNTNVFTDFFNNLFGGSNHHDADRYSKVAGQSKAIVTVHARSGEEAEAAADILDDCGALDVDERTARDGSAGSERSGDNKRQAAMGGDEDITIPVIREALQVDKRTEERGSVRVRSRIIEQPVEEHLRLREEHVRVERNPVDRPIGSADTGAFSDGTIELTEKAEVPVVHKEARVVEEVRLNKEVTERDETVRDTVRETDVDLEGLDRNSHRPDGSSERGAGQKDTI